MKASSFGELSKWLDSYKTKKFNVLFEKQIDRNVLKTFEKRTGIKIEYFSKNINKTNNKGL